MVDGTCSGNVKVIPGVRYNSVLGSLLCLSYTSDLPIILESTFVGYTDDSTLLTELPESGSRVPTLLFINRDLARIGDWYICWQMLANPMKTETIVIYRSGTLAPCFLT